MLQDMHLQFLNPKSITLARKRAATSAASTAITTGDGLYKGAAKVHRGRRVTGKHGMTSNLERRLGMARNGAVSGGGGGGRFVDGEEWARVTGVAYWDTKSTEKRSEFNSSMCTRVGKHTALELDDDLDCNCCVKKECRRRRIARDMLAENLKLQNEIREQNSVILRLKTEGKMRSKVHKEEIRARDRKEIVFVTLAVGFCIVYAMCALCVRGYP